MACFGVCGSAAVSVSADTPLVTVINSERRVTAWFEHCHFHLFPAAFNSAAICIRLSVAVCIVCVSLTLIQYTKRTVTSTNSGQSYKCLRGALRIDRSGQGGLYWAAAR